LPCADENRAEKCWKGQTDNAKICLTNATEPASIQPMKQWLTDYIQAQKAAHESIPLDSVAQLIEKLRLALKEDRQILVFGNGGSAANASHFATDLGKGASDKLGKRFRVLSLTDNVSWMTALGNDYSYEDIFVGQLQNYGKPGDIALGISVSGNSPNCVKALEWARKNGLRTVALVGAKRGRMAEIAEQVIVIADTHYGRVEDAHMGICHMLCYAFMEHPEIGR
jgi:D-sedoheptulose 7-phosphate isomerase